MDIHNLQNVVAAFAGKKVAVIGDLMLDAYVWGNAQRISPEAPVPVVNAEKESCCLGGAANVMRNIVTLGGSACAYGVLGNDSDGNMVREMLAGYRIDCRNVLPDNQRRTTRKQRILAGGQQLLRIDHEDTFDLNDEIRSVLFDKLSNDIKHHLVDAVIFEDYAKGVLSSGLVDSLVKVAQEAGVITALDPKPGNIAPVSGITIMKPNRGEAFAMCGRKNTSPAGRVQDDEALLQVAEQIQKTWNVEQLLVSLAAQGMALFRLGQPVVVIPTKAREVFDVSGAGDTVIGTYTLALCAGATPEEAALVANYAAGVVVGKVGTVTVGKDELLQAFEDERP